MKQLIKNFLWKFKWCIAILSILVIAISAAWITNTRAERAVRQRELEKLRQAEKVKYHDQQIAAEKEKLAHEERVRQEQLRVAERIKRENEESVQRAKLSKARYIGNNQTKWDVAVIAVDENNRLNESLAFKLSSNISTPDIKCTSSLFTTAFVADGLFFAIASGAKYSFEEIEITNATKTICLVWQTVGYTTNDSLNGIITANMMLAIKAFSTDENKALYSKSINSSGVGFKQVDARLMAEERIVESLMTNDCAVIRKTLFFTNP